MKIQTKNFLWGIAFLMIGVACIFGLFIDLTGDSGLHAAISRQMVESGDWLNLTINGEPYDQKPHLLFWLAGLGIELFGNSNFAFKLFPFLFALSSLWFVYKLGKLLFSYQAGLTAALIAGTSQMFFLYLLDIHTDTILQAGISLALWQLIAFLEKRKAVHFIWGFVGIGLAMLAKGPVGAVLPFFTVLFYLIVKKDFRRLFHPKWFLGILIVLVVISPTLWHLFDSFGWEGIRFYFITNNLGRVTGEYAGSSTDPFYYLYNMLWAFLPWTVFIVAAIIFEIKSWFSTDKKINPGRAALLGSVLVLLFVYSISKGKAPHYFLIMVGPLAVVTGGYLNRFRKMAVEGRRILCAQGAVLTIMFLIFIAIVFFLSEKVSWLPVFLLAVLFIAAGIFIQKEKESWRRLIFFSVLVSGIVNVFLNAEFIPGLFRYQGARQALEVFEENQKPEDKLYNFALEEYELFFMADEAEEVKTPQRLYKLLEKEKTWVYTNQIKYNDIKRNMESKIDTVFVIRHRGMNELNFRFLNPKTRGKSLTPNYLIKAK
ncbi:MAG TPA: glycosyltransferase family 39 protein [Tangfeifania sp.]|nr:glycosyltransferase family 39 protein [Tangfeifania sp.]